LAEKAEQGDLQAIREIADRLDGRPPQAIERHDAQSMARVQKGRSKQ